MPQGPVMADEPGVGCATVGTSCAVVRPAMQACERMGFSFNDFAWPNHGMHFQCIQPCTLTRDELANPWRNLSDFNSLTSA